MNQLLHALICFLLVLGTSRGEKYPAPGDSVLCPADVCRCGLDKAGRVTIVCDRGNLTDPIPVRSMDSHMEVLSITSTEDNPNWLTIGPIFQDFGRLEELRITHSSIPAIGKNTFWGLRLLRILDLSANNISTLTESNFRGLINLQELYLNDNTIDSIPSAAFRHLSSLKKLELNNNRVTELVPRLFYGLHKLEYLDLSANQLGDLEAEVFRDVRLVKTFKCRRCGLSFINPLLLHLLAEVSALDLGDNQFHYVDNNAFRDVKQLKHLYLDGNLLNVLTADVLKGHKLATLSLARNRIITLAPGSFLNVSVESLDLSYNRIQSFDPSLFIPLSNSLDRLNLAGNPLQVSHIWSNVLGPRTGITLTQLDLSDIPLGMDPLFTPELFSSQESLRNLNMSGCSLTNLHSDIVDRLPKLSTLDLSRNLLTSMTDSLLKSLSSLPDFKEIVLHGNLWHCEACVIGPLLKWLDVHPAAQAIKDNCRGLRSNALHGAEDSGFPCPVCKAPGPVAGVELPRLDHINLPSCNLYPPVKNLDGLPDSTVRLEGSSVLRASKVESKWSVLTLLLENPLYMGLALGIAVLLLIAVCSAFAVFYRHAASYYTHEEKRHPCKQSEEQEEVHQKLFTQTKDTSLTIELEEEPLQSFINNNKKKMKKLKKMKDTKIGDNSVSRGVRCYNGGRTIPQERVLR